MKVRTPTQRRVLLAHSIIEYGVILDGMRALARVGVAVPTMTMGAVETERLTLFVRWIRESQAIPELRPLSETSDPAQIVGHARAYLHCKDSELSELLNETREVT